MVADVQDHGFDWTNERLDNLLLINHCGVILLGQDYVRNQMKIVVFIINSNINFGLSKSIDTNWIN